MKKNIVRSVAVLMIVFVVFSVIVFVAPFVKSTIFWLSYVFALLSVCIQGNALYTGFARGEQKHSKLYGFPIARLGALYMAGQISASLVFMACGQWVPVWIVVVLYVVALAAVAVGMIGAEAAREEIESQDVKLHGDVQTMRALQSKARSLVGLCRDQDTAAALARFSEDLQYSDPVSGDALRGIESELSALVDDMQKALVEGDFRGAMALLPNATAVLNERNRLCKLNKA